MKVRIMLLVVLVSAIATGTASATNAPPWSFVTRSGSQLMLNGQQFRFSGANIEWLGLVGYGPRNFQPGQSERFPTEFEINDALATAKAMGATVVRAQTLGDTVGCPNCLEPALGQFNPAAFRVMDYAIMRARYYGIRLILEFQGDSRAVNGSSSNGVFSQWAGGKDFWSDPTVIGDFEAHIKAVIDHVNSYTHIPYKNDPTILGWMDCNDCQMSGGSDTWVSTIAGYIKSLDPNHLEISNAPLIAPDARLLSDPAIDAFSAEVYPHWLPELDGDKLTGDDPLVHSAAQTTARAGKVWFASEFGWDATDWSTPAALQHFLAGMQQDPNVSGDLFWALEGHASGHGWTPIPADSNCQLLALDTSPPADVPSLGQLGCELGEDGSWWALYDTGVPTAANTAADMATRAGILRAHAYAMRGVPTPPDALPPAPIITQTAGGTLYWEGSAGARDYSIQRATTTAGPWTTLCDECVTDMSDGWQEPSTGCFRVIPYNEDGAAGAASTPAGPGCAKPRSSRRAHRGKPHHGRTPGGKPHRAARPRGSHHR